MSELDIRNSPDYSIYDPVCTKCFEDEDITGKGAGHEWHLLKEVLIDWVDKSI